MSNLFSTLLSLALLLVLMSACNRDAVDSGTNNSGAFLAPAAAPPNSTARTLQQEGQLQDAPMKEEDDVLPGEDEVGAERLNAEQINAARTAGPGRGPGSSQVSPSAGQTVAPEGPKTMNAPTSTAGKAVSDFDQPVMTVSKTACNGNCRQYTLSLTNNRRLLLNAGKNMDRKGKYSRVLNTREYNEIMAAMQAAKPESLAALYPSNIKQVPADAQGTVLRYPGSDGNERRVEVYYEAPDELDAFLTTFEAWVDKDGWIKMAE